MVLTLRLPGKGAPGIGIVQAEKHPEQDKLQKERGLVRYGSAEHRYRRKKQERHKNRAAVSMGFGVAENMGSG